MTRYLFILLSAVVAGTVQGQQTYNNTTCAIEFCSDGRNCAHPSCQGCPFTCYKSVDSSSQCQARHPVSRTCTRNCSPDLCSSDKCRDCIFCSGAPSSTTCPLGTFQDVTDSLLNKNGDDAAASAYWYQWRKTGKPYNHFSSPVMVDLDGDLILDYFNSLHAEPMSQEPNMELAIMKHDSTNDSYRLTPLENRIILQDVAENGYFAMDNHGDVVVDLDNDGILDIYVASGGGGGKPMNNPQSRDNLVFFGEQLVANGGDNENVVAPSVIFKGGRARALESNIHARMGRGRFTYLLDVNGDGLLDIFTSNDRRVDNSLAPGVLHINEGNRTWRIDESMSEFSNSMILTDADGDGRAEEFMITRGFCFPDRDDPDADAEFGSFPEDIKAFCSTRPVGTTAVYKYNPLTMKMEDISQPYVNIQAGSSYQPECCPHGLPSGAFDCSVVSLASADLDSDGKSDHVFLYKRKMQFYFSSDRPKGTLPIGNQYIGLTIDLPPSCSVGESIRILDLDNSSKLNIIVMCHTSGTVLIYTQGDTKDSWTLENGCNENGSLGDLSFSAFEWQTEDFLDACENRDTWKKLAQICDDYELNGKKEIPLFQGITFADINNDGFADAIISTKLGYQRFFLNVPSVTASSNKFLSFRLIGDGKEVNKYGIGVTLRLICKDRKIRVRQIREVSSYQHSTDQSGSIDEKITFGLGMNLRPIRVIAFWPNGLRQVLNLRQFDFSSPSKIIDIRYPPQSNASKYVNIQLRQQSKSANELCLSVGQERDLRIVKFEPCASSPHQTFWFDTSGRLRNDVYSDRCVTVRYKSKTIRFIDCNKAVSKKNSWHLTPDGSFLRASGTNMVLGIESFSNSTTGEIAALVDMNNGPKQGQKIKVRKVH